MTRRLQHSEHTNCTSAVETLERRQLLSASLAGSFVGVLPTAVLPGKLNNHVTVRVSNTSDSRDSGRTGVGLYVSTTPDLQGDSVLVGTAMRNLRLRAGQSANFPFRFAFPSDLPDGEAYLVAKIQGPAGSYGTSGETIAVAPQTVAVVQPSVDLTGQAAGPAAPLVETGNRPAHGVMRVLVQDAGNMPAKGKLLIAADISLSGTFDGGSIGIGSVTVPAVTIKPGASRQFLVPLTVPANTPGGTYTLFANINADHWIAESNFANNVATAAGPLILSSPTATLGAGGGGGGGGGAGSGSGAGGTSGGNGAVNGSTPPVRIIGDGGHGTIAIGIGIGNSPGDTPPCAGGPSDGTSGGDTSDGGNSDDNGSGTGSSCGGTDSGTDPSGGSDTSGGDTSDDGTAGGDTSGSDTSGGESSGGDSAGSDGAGGGADAPTDGGSDTGTPADPTDPGGGSSDTSSDGGSMDGTGSDDNTGSDFGGDSGTDPGAGTEFGGDDSTGSDFSGGDNGSDFGGPTDFSEIARKPSPVARSSPAPVVIPAHMRRLA
jgi:hypothetical protein